MAYGQGYGPGWPPAPTQPQPRPRRRHHGWIVVAIIAIALALGLGGFVAYEHIVGSDASSAAASATKYANGCTDPSAVKGVKYYAYDTTGRRFASPITATTTTGALKVFTVHMHCDPIFAATQIEYANHGVDLDPRVAQSEAAKFVADRSMWAKAVKKFFATSSNWALTNDFSAGRRSLGMIPGSDSSQMPALTGVVIVPGSVGRVLEFSHKGDDDVMHTRKDREACGDQPLEDVFTHVPVGSITPPVAPKHTPTPNSTPTPHSTPPSGKPSCKTTRTCKPSTPPVGCQATNSCHSTPPVTCTPSPCHTCGSTPCVTKTEASQPKAAPPTSGSSTWTADPPSNGPTSPANTDGPIPTATSGNPGGSMANPIVSGPPPTDDGGSHTDPVPTPTGGAFGSS